MRVTSARLPINDVNIEVMTPRVSTTAKPRTGPLPNTHSTRPAMMVVTLESAMAETGVTRLKQMGVVMKAAQALAALERFDGKALSERVRSKLS